MEGHRAIRLIAIILNIDKESYRAATLACDIKEGSNRSNVPKTKEGNDTIFYIKANGPELGLVFQDA